MTKVIYLALYITVNLFISLSVYRTPGINQDTANVRNNKSNTISLENNVKSSRL